MSQLGVHQQIATPGHSRARLFPWLWQTLCQIYARPFRMASFSPSADDVEPLEQQRRIHIFRLIVVSYTACLLLLALVLFVFSRASPFFRWSDLCVVGLNIGCLALSYYRWSTVATIIFLLTSLGFCLTIIEHDIDVLNPRSLLIYSLISLLILMAGIVLPHNLSWLVIPVMIAITLTTLTMLPIQIADPRAVIIGVLLIQYVFSAMLTWLYVRSSSLRVKTLSTALAYEQDLLQQKDAFINIAGHELRTPLTMLVLDCHLIERCLQHPERTERLAAVTGYLSTHVKRMDAMIAMLLDASRASLDQFMLNKESCDVAACIRSAVAEQAQIAARHVELQGSDEPIDGFVDCRRLWQVMTNLVGNALKFSTATDNVNVTVAVILRDAARLLHVEVCDTGPGIAPQALKHLFVRNYRAHDDHLEHQAGLGLGLYITNTIITLHGGTIWVNSQLGQGSTFSFELPLS